MFGTTTDENLFPDNVSLPWAGADNTNHHFDTQDFFDRTKTQLGVASPGFSDRLQNAGGSNDTYNAYTFYRMLAQLGTDSSPDRGKININYKNTDNSGNIVPGMETNLIPWTPIDFFTNAANAMFLQNPMRDYNGNLITVTNIPIYETNTAGVNINYYTPAVHRILQLAANMYDATTNRFIGNGPTNYPSVFRPIFRSQDGVVSIAGYQEVVNSSDAFLPFLDVQTFATANQTRNNINIYGVPWVIGAKKGFPNFNEFSMENPLQVSRKLQFTNNTANPPWVTNQVFDFSITNSFGVEAWNSYTNNYNRSLRLVVSNELSITITNQFGYSLLNVSNLLFSSDQTYPTWPGWTEQLSDNSFKLPLFVSETYTNGIYTPPASVFGLSPPVWSVTFVPHLWMELQFKLQFILIDTTANRIVDFVNLASTQPVVDVASMLDNGADGREDPNNSPDGQWDTNFLNSISGISKGIYDQIGVSYGTFTANDWNDTPANVTAAQALFRKRLNNSVTNNFQAPYTPARTIYQRISWQANDPLVHYTAADLTSTNGTQALFNTVGLNAINGALTNLMSLNFAYQPWGGYGTPPGTRNFELNQNQQFDYNWQVKDPMVDQSDNWDFPTNKLANIGWMGRIHRGTPWQTIYMKPANINIPSWTTWDNDNALIQNRDNTITTNAVMTHPTDDYRLFDLFTTAVNENASRGRLDVNQTNLAAWSAVLSGVNIITNSVTGVTGPAVIQPAGVYDPTNPSPVAAIVQGINATRSSTNLAFLNGNFQHLGDVLAAPQLTYASPFLNTNALATPGAGGISDEVMERIPQQVMSLLTLNQTPRFVIYSFGQTLHPADHSLVIGGTFNGLCTNYQITAESATRAVVRVEGSPDPQYTNDVTNPHPDPQGRFYPPHIVVEQFNVLGPE
jgi:hypothetical protein